MSLYGREKIEALQREMVALGPRLTGSAAHQAYVDSIRRELKALGLKPCSDAMRMKTVWTPLKWSLHIDTANGKEEIPAYYYPYSGETPPEGITAKLIYCGKNNFGTFLGARDKIAVVKMSVFEAEAGLIFKKRSVLPAGYTPPERLASPVVSSFLAAPQIKRAKLVGAKGVICIMSGCSPGNAAYQYLPFITSYKGIPALWVDEEGGKKVLEAEKTGGTSTITLIADVRKKAPTETVYAVLEGSNPKETILINTHTDGTNAFEENGPIALLSIAKHFSEMPIEQRRRTLVFSFVTGHFQLPQFGSPMLQATNRFLRKHTELWLGIGGAAKAVAGVSIEHLGCTEWRDSPDHKEYLKVDDIDPELVFVANKKLNDVYLAACEGRKHLKTLTLRPKNLVYFGEGQPMYMAGIPTISLVPGPDYLCTNAPDGYLDKLNFDLMEEQIATFSKVIERLDKMSKKEIGRPDLFAYGLKM
jgi:hypothetical protein